MTTARRKILVISGVFPPTRIADADHVQHLCAKLAERGFEVAILTTRNGGDYENLPFRVFPVMSKWNWAELPRLAWVVKDFAPDIVFQWFLGHAYHFHPMATILPTIVKRLLPHVTYVTQFSFPEPSRPWLQSLLTRAIWKAIGATSGPNKIDYRYGALLRDSDKIIAMADTHLATFAATLPQVRAKGTVVPPPSLLVMSPDDAETRAKARQTIGAVDSDFVYAYFGRLYRGKGLETLLEAFHRVRTRNPSVKLVIIGGADANWHQDSWRVEDLYQQARTLGIEGDVVWTGEYSWDSDLGSTYLRAADVAVLPFEQGIHLNNSSFSGVAAHGLPTITTRGPTMDGPFRDGENVVLCPPQDPSALAAAMEQLLVNPAQRQRLRSGIEVIAKEWFSWERALDRTIAAFGPASHAANQPVVEAAGINLLGGR